MEQHILNSWKEIAVYLDRGVRTAQRWEALLGMPVHRPSGKSRSAVLAFPEELQAWLHADGMSAALQLEPVRTNEKKQIDHHRLLRNAQRMQELAGALFLNSRRLESEMARSLRIQSRINGSVKAIGRRGATSEDLESASSMPAALIPQISQVEAQLTATQLTSGRRLIFGS